MTWRPGSAALAPVAAVALSAISVAQAASGTHVTSRVVWSGGAVLTTSPERPQEVAVAVLLALATTAPVSLARLWPAIGAALSATATVLCLLAQIPPTLGGMLALGALYVAVGLRHRAAVVGGLIAPFVLCVVLPGTDPTIAMLLLVLVVLAGAGGVGWRVRREMRHKDAEVEAAQESALEHLARGERARITRELHDVVAHHISLIALQADAARLTVPDMPPEGERRLVAIGDGARTALAEMRRLLGVLREDVDADASSRRPQPGLAQLTDLLDEVRSAGPGATRLIVSGGVAPLDRGTELTVFRIVQEALTNARRHAVGAAVDVELRYRPDRLVVRVRDNGPGPSAADGGLGHGLAGMRERVAMAGGTLWTGEGSLGGFMVHAELPIEGGAPA